MLFIRIFCFKVSKRRNLYLIRCLICYEQQQVCNIVWVSHFLLWNFGLQFAEFPAVVDTDGRNMVGQKENRSDDVT